MTVRLLLVAALVAAALGGCGREPDDNAPGQRAIDKAVAGNAPACSQVWVEGRTLPASYRGCNDGGVLEAAVRYDCLDGGSMAIYAERFYARLGGPVIAVEGDISEDERYAEFWHDCQG